MRKRDWRLLRITFGLSWWLRVKNLPASSTDVCSITGLRRSLGEGNGNPLQYLCLENSIDRESLVVYTPWGHKRVRHNLVTEQQQNLDHCNLDLVFQLNTCFTLYFLKVQEKANESPKYVLRKVYCDKFPVSSFLFFLYILLLSYSP